MFVIWGTIDAAHKEDDVFQETLDQCRCKHLKKYYQLQQTSICTYPQTPFSNGRGIGVDSRGSGDEFRSFGVLFMFCAENTNCEQTF